jgi:hypothetical protein
LYLSSASGQVAAWGIGVAGFVLRRSVQPQKPVAYAVLAALARTIVANVIPFERRGCTMGIVM